jgi:hypothetical protein
MKKDHDLAHDLLHGPRRFNLASALRTNAFNLLQPARTIFDDIENLFAKLCDQFRRVNRADASDQAAAEVLLDPFVRGRGCAPHQFRAELPAKLTVVNPATFCRQPFAGIGGGKRSDNRNELAMAFGFDPKDGKAVFVV